MGIPVGWVTNPLFIVLWFMVLLDALEVVDFNLIKWSVLSIVLLVGLWWLSFAVP